MLQFADPKIQAAYLAARYALGAADHQDVPEMDRVLKQELELCGKINVDHVKRVLQG